MNVGYAINPTRTQESYAITKRREVNAHYSQFENIVHDDRVLGHRAHWENNSSKMIERNAIANIARGIEATNLSKLEARRQRLAGLLNADESQYRVELTNLRETSQQKAMRLVNQARKLKAEREEKRKQFAQDMYNRRWREACDDLRHIGSENFAKYCREEIAAQREEKVLKKQYERNEEKVYAQQWEAERMSRVEKENDLRKQRQRSNYETKLALFDQMEAARQEKLKEAYQTELDRDAFRKQMEEDNAFAVRCNEENAAESKRRMAEILDFNSRTQAAKAEVARIQRAEEIQDLNNKMDAHRAELQAKQAKKERMREDMKKYMAYLSQKREENRLFQAEIERLTLEEGERENAKRDAQWQREQDTRDRLKEDVYRGRAQQLAQLAETARQTEAELEVERQLVLAEAKGAQLREFQEEEAYRQRELNHQQHLMRQMQQNRSNTLLLESLAIEEREQGIEAERQYRAFVQREKQRAHDEGIQIKASVFDR